MRITRGVSKATHIKTVLQDRLQFHAYNNQEQINRKVREEEKEQVTIRKCLRAAALDDLHSNYPTTKSKRQQHAINQLHQSKRKESSYLFFEINLIKKNGNQNKKSPRDKYPI